MANSFGFIIASCLEKEEHKNALKECIDSIRLFHSEHIVVVFSLISDKALVDSIMEQYPTVTFELNHSEEYAAAVLVYKYFYEKKYFSTAIILQDSMKLLKKIDINTSFSNVQYLWHFTNHRKHWHSIVEPQTDYNLLHNIKTHDDLVLHYCTHELATDAFREYCKNIYYQKDKWVGVFGFTSVITHAFLCDMQHKTHFIDIIQLMSSNRNRRAAESLFPLACQFTLGSEIHDSLDGLYYDGTYHNGWKGNYIYKTTFGR